MARAHSYAWKIITILIAVIWGLFVLSLRGMRWGLGAPIEGPFIIEDLVLWLLPVFLIGWLGFASETSLKRRGHLYPLLIFYGALAALCAAAVVVSYLITGPW